MPRARYDGGEASYEARQAAVAEATAACEQALAQAQSLALQLQVETERRVRAETQADSAAATRDSLASRLAQLQQAAADATHLAAQERAQLVAHAEAVEKGAAVIWSDEAHLAFASLLFPLVFKALATERGWFSISEPDRTRLALVDYYVEHDPMLTSNTSAGSATHPWQAIELHARSVSMVRCLWPKLGTGD